LSEHTLSLYAGRNPQLSIIFFNLNDPTVQFFQDALVRKALCTALNRQGMINTLWMGRESLLMDRYSQEPGRTMTICQGWHMILKRKEHSY